MPIPVADRAPNANELVDMAAELLSRSDNRRRVFKAIYTGKQRSKTVPDLCRATRLDKFQVLKAGKALASNEVVQQIKAAGGTAYEKIDFFQHRRDKILRLARNAAAREALPTKRRPSIAGKILRLNYELRVPRKFVQAALVTVDAISSFERVKAEGPALEYREIAERDFKLGISKILGEPGVLQDWGGELSDLFSTHLVIAGERRATAFAFKGPGTRGRLTPGKMGKNGDQIQRLARCPADVFIVQYWGEIDLAVLEQLRNLIQAKAFLERSRLWYGLIDGNDSVRLMRAYPESFPNQEAP